MKSIIVDDLKKCYVCGATRGIEVHHCIHGTAGRKLATKYHLVVGLCPFAPPRYKRRTRQERARLRHNPKEISTSKMGGEIWR